MVDALPQAELAARTSYGRLLALLAARTGDVVDAEDALADAFEKAVRLWPEQGVPANPDGWLLTVARNRLRDHWKSAAHRRTADWDDSLTEAVPDDDQPDPLDFDAIEDRRLELLLVCAHPAIDPTVHTPLMLNTVLGCTAEQIARAFALPTATLASRLVRAKKRIKQARIPFRLPDRTALPQRLDAVLQAVYGGYAIDWSTGVQERTELAGETRHLAELVAELTGDPEAYGLAALINFSSARLAARTDTDGRFVPLDDQDPQRWDSELIMRGRELLARAPGGAELGRFQLEAAIQALHCARLDAPGNPDNLDNVDRALIARLHHDLHRLAPGLGTTTALAAAVAAADGPAAGLALLERELGEFDADQARRFQPAWAIRASLLWQLARPNEALTALDTAIGLTHDPVQRTHLERLRTR